MNIIIYQPLQNSRRIKVFIPYEMATERNLIKTIHSRFYHRSQKLWSVMNTEANYLKLKEIFNGKYTIEGELSKVNMPKFTLNPKCELAMAGAEQKLILMAYSPHTIRNYKAELARYLKYFENYEHKNITKEEIESYVYYMVTKYRIGESKQNGMINAIIKNTSPLTGYLKGRQEENILQPACRRFTAKHKKTQEPTPGRHRIPCGTPMQRICLNTVKT